MKSYLRTWLVIVSLLLATSAQAGSATWSASPASGDWNTAANWMPNTVPNSLTDIATFATSTVTQVSLTSTIDLASLQFNPGADSFSFTAPGGAALVFVGDGIVNNSGTTQQFTATRDSSSVGAVDFFNSASCGDGTNFSVLGGVMYFGEVATAATAHFTVSDESGIGGAINFFGGTAANATFSIGIDGSVNLYDNSTAPNAYFTVTGGTLSITGTSYAGESVIDCSEGGAVIFSTYRTAGVGSPQVTAHGATSSGGQPGSIYFIQGGAADHATFVVEGGTIARARGAVMSVRESSTLQSAQVTVTGGSSGGDRGSILFAGKSDGESARIIMSGDANFDMSKHDPVFLRIGSIEGQGSVFLGSNQLQLGNNNLNATFSGVVQEDPNQEGAGSLNKIGTGILTLSGANTYTGGTTLTAGGLVISNTIGSGTGTGTVTVQAGTLGGKGIIAGPTTIGTGSFLQPGKGASAPATLIIQNTLTFNSDGTYLWKLNTNKAKADQVIANGIIIDNGAQFSFKAVANKKLTAGTVFTALSNTSASPISGAFPNLPDGSTFTVGNNTFQVDYQGGDGNDLTLTVVP